MSTAMKIVIGIAVIGFIMVGITAMSLQGTYNTLVTMEENIKSQHKSNKNTYDNMWKTFKESAQVTDMYAADTQKLFAQVIEGRKGSQTELFRMVKEANPALDASLYKQLQSAIEGGRATFKENQDILIDKTRQYENELRIFPTNVIAGFFGFPKIDLSKYGIITSDRTEGAFASGKDEEVKLR